LATIIKHGLAAMAVSASLASAAQEADAAFVSQNLDKETWGQDIAVGSVPVEVPGWVGFLTQHFFLKAYFRHLQHHVTLFHPDNPSNATTRDMLVTGCAGAGVASLRVCAERVALRVKCQSGNQFPVAGFVDEGPLYVFRDGVTVGITGVKDSEHRTDWLYRS